MTTFKRWLKNWSIKSHLIIGVTIVHAVLMTFFIFDSYFRQADYVRKSLKNEANNFVHTISFAAKHWVLSKDLEGLSEIVKSQKKLNNLEQVFIIDSKGKILAHTQESLVGSYVSDAKSIELLQDSRKEAFIIYEDNLSLDFASPVIFQNTTYGWVRARFSTAELSAILDKLLWNGVLYTLIAILTGWGMAYFLARVLTKQLTAVADVAVKFKDGDRSIRADSFDTKEVATLSHVFNEMMITINQEELALRNSEDKLKKSQERFSLAMEGSNEGLYDYDLITKDVFYSPRWKKNLGYEDHEILNDFHEWISRIHSEDVEQTLQSVKNYLKSDGKEIYESVFRMQHKNGTYIYIFAKGFCLRDSNNIPYRMIGTHNDITAQVKSQQEKENLQSRFIETAKMAALGEMSGGIAHEINNPLTIIIGKTEQLIRYLDKVSERKESYLKDLELIKKTALRISKIIKGLRSFSRNAENDPMQEVNLKSIIDETLDLCREKFSSSGIEIHSEVPNIQVKCRAVELSQVLMNLFSNSYDAISELEEKWISLQVSEVADKVRIQFKDSGKGIPTSVVDKIFQPFYTTKDVGKGTGLGLSISAGIMKNHGGSLDYDKSSPNTCFLIELPALHKQVLKLAA